MSDATSVVVYDPHTTDREVIAAAAFLAGYSGRTREAYTLDPRQFVGWCREHGLGLFDIRRAEIELYARHLEQQGKARATIGRRLSTIAGFYRYAAEEGIITHSPAANVRRPRLDYESHAVGLDRNELGAFLVAAGSEVGDVAREIVDRDPDPTALVNALRGERIGHSRADTSWQLLFDEFRIQAARRDDVGIGWPATTNISVHSSRSSSIASSRRTPDPVSPPRICAHRARRRACQPAARRARCRPKRPHALGRRCPARRVDRRCRTATRRISRHPNFFQERRVRSTSPASTVTLGHGRDQGREVLPPTARRWTTQRERLHGDAVPVSQAGGHSCVKGSSS